MSIFVNVKINEDTLIDLKIGSATWPQELNDVVEYSVTTIDDLNWENEIKFQHRFGDGIAICVQEALTAITANKTIPNDGQIW